MPRFVRRKVAEFHEVHAVKTLWDRIKAFLDGLAGVAVVMVILIAIFG